MSSTFFQQTYQHICVSLNVNFNDSLTNDSLTNDVVSFEQLSPGSFVASFHKGDKFRNLLFALLKSGLF